MTKNRKATPSKKERRAALERQRQQQRQMQWGILALVALAVVALTVWQLWPRAEPEPVILEGERPLAELEPAARNNIYTTYPEMVIDESKTYQAIMRTARGDMTFDLYADAAPLTVNNFVFLANQGFYDGTMFHRVLEDFMAQGGDPSGTGTGGPGYQFADEVDNGLAFDQPGLLAMANAGPGTNGSQFFITYSVAGTQHLTGRHTIFGEIVAGEDVLFSIPLRDPLAANEPGEIIERIDIVEK